MSSVRTRLLREDEKTTGSFKWAYFAGGLVVFAFITLQMISSEHTLALDSSSPSLVTLDEASSFPEDSPVSLEEESKHHHKHHNRHNHNGHHKHSSHRSSSKRSSNRKHHNKHHNHKHSGHHSKNSVHDTDDEETTEITQQEANPAEVDTSYNEWFLYKQSYVIRNGTVDEVWSFVENLGMGWGCAKVSLGCGFKLTCNFMADGNGMDAQLHWVEGARIGSEASADDGWGVPGWQEHFDKAIDVRGSYNAFELNKMQVYVTNITATIARLESFGYSYRTRLSMAAGTEIRLAHLGVKLAGRIWEFVGRAPKDLSKDFQFWLPDECPSAHEVHVDIQNLEERMKAHSHSNSSVWISTTIATANLESKGLQDLFNDSTTLTNAKHQIHEGAKCTVHSLSWNGAGAHVRGIRYVEPHGRDQDEIDEVSDYEQYITTAHKRYLTQPLEDQDKYRWRNWDNWLDQHFGVQYNITGGNCERMNSKVRKRLIEEKLPLAQRAGMGEGDHYYVGYPNSSVTFEYNTLDCYHGVGVTNVCMCDLENSDLLYVELYGNATASATCPEMDDEGLSIAWD